MCCRSFKRNFQHLTISDCGSSGNQVPLSTVNKGALSVHADWTQKLLCSVRNSSTAHELLTLLKTSKWMLLDPELFQPYIACLSFDSAMLLSWSTVLGLYRTLQQWWHMRCVTVSGEVGAGSKITLIQTQNPTKRCWREGRVCKNSVTL